MSDAEPKVEEPKVEDPSVENPKGKIPIPETVSTKKPLLVFKRAAGGNSTSVLYADIPDNNSSTLKLSALRKPGKIGIAERFCLADESTIVKDDMTLEQYLSLTPDNIKHLAATETAATVSLTIHVLSILTRAEGKSVELEKFDPTIHRREGPRAEVTAPTTEHRASGLKADDWKTTSASKITHPADLTKVEWEIVLRNNTLTHGFVVYQDRILPARRPAFKIKERDVDQYVAVNDDDEKPGGKTTIPEFRVFDQSSVSVLEISNEAQESMAKNAFSSQSLDASVKGGAFGVEAGVSGGFAKSNSDGNSTKSKEFKAKMDVSYNFPRVMLFLDSETLEPTKECAADLEKIKSFPWETKKKQREAAINQFYMRYGHLFATVVRLGGRLTSSKLIEHFEEGSSAERAAELKISAGASFSSPYVSGSVNYSNEEGDDKKEIKSKMKRTESLTWDATGGDTLLCSNPPAWAATVQDFYNWRVVERSDPRPIIDILGAKDQFILNQGGPLRSGKTGGK